MLDNNRTKRRKISQRHDKVVPVQDTGMTGPGEWHDQLTHAAGSDFEQKGLEKGQSDVGRWATQSVATSRDPGSESHGQRSTALQQSSLDRSSNFLSHPPQPLPETDPVIEASLSATTSSLPDPTMGTPRKTSVRLGANGKLTNSPRRSQKKSPLTGNDATVKAPSKSRKVQMKNGKFVSSLRITLSYASPDYGKKIDEILSLQPHCLNNPPAQALAGRKKAALGGSKIVHPFFRGKSSTKSESRANSEPASTGPVSEDEAKTTPKAPKPWNNIVFGSRSVQKSLPGVDPIWPPNSLHNVQPEERLSLPNTTSLFPTTTSKSKQKATSQIDAIEDVLRLFLNQLKADMCQPVQPVHLPARVVMSGKALFEALTPDSLSKTVTNGLRSRIETQASAFDRGLASGPHMWPQAYAPDRWEAVLQPQAQVLHDWLTNLEVHNVQSGHTQGKPRPAIQKKRRKRKSGEMDDFLADSDDDASNNMQAPKNAILLTGPSGSGKTASVYAVAQQLGFEIFEIHPGMRRNARDIMDQVGDMTQNHLVQKAAGISSRRSSMSASDTDGVPSLPVSLPSNQQTMAAFMGNGNKSKKPTSAVMEGGKGSKAKVQKQSLILFEEVDILFDEDKGFWSAVQALIQTSKRPVILTCNDATSVPADDLNLYATLEYEKPSPDVAIQYLRSIAASEGHLLSAEAVHNLYLSKGCDLRASLTELNFWCQMTVGSQQGGIDWMMPYNERSSTSFGGSVTRIVSKDTFLNGHDLLPTDTHNSDELISFAMDQLDVSALDWVNQDLECSNDASGVQRLDDLFSLCEARSCMDILDDTVSPVIAGQIKRITSTNHVHPREELIEHYLSPRRLPMTPSNILEAFDPLTEETRIGLPQPPGRKAPSLDSSAAYVVTDIAPYVRHIVLYDQRLEALRNSLDGGSQSSNNKRQRRTRASRAALEGGTKVSTRRDKWFTDSLDFDAVLATGGAWPHAQPLHLEESIEETGSVGVASSSASLDNF